MLFLKLLEFDEFKKTLGEQLFSSIETVHTWLMIRSIIHLNALEFSDSFVKSQYIQISVGRP